jgi:iron-sulfur cluster repair protein YtfE (RIC family)
MELESLRQDLLQQHREVRRLVTNARRLSTQISKGGPVAAPAKRLRELLVELNRTLEVHWAFESEALNPILKTIDAWGPERVRRMETDHRAEHDAMAGAMGIASGAGTPKKLAAATHSMANELIAHMEDEEKYLLGRNVLTWEIMRLDQPTD